MEEREHTKPRKMQTLDSTGNNLSASLGSHCLWIIHFLKVCPPLQRTQHRVSDLCQGTQDALKEGSLSLMAYCSAPTSCPPRAHSWCKGGRAELLLVLIRGGLFCFISSNSLCKMFHNKLFLCYLLAALCEQAGRAWCINVGIHSSPPAWSEILPNTHTEGCWLPRLCSTFTALAVLKFN